MFNQQISIFDYQKNIETSDEVNPDINPKQKETPKEFSDYIGWCEYCYWGTDEETCHWSVNCKDKHHKAVLCECDANHSFWKPNCWKIPHLCGNCKHSNMFAYRSTNEYVKDGVLHKDGYFPIEEPNIYCLRNGGSVNRTRPYEEFCTENFGVGHWHRQREWDTCDAWELDSCYHKYLKEEK